ncbi:sterol desaturase family protein [Brevibacillus laterosporus]|uniref:Fatty acid hydroxylase n=1 Tax=Brevibacillus laterosporus TaxID=1465 RepID=A0A0F6XZI8_BRELA|nr:fatty acid hydroxylase [Brevibacillus laterosporus]
MIRKNRGFNLLKGYVIQYFSQFDVLVISILFAFGFLWLIPDMERIHIWMALAIGMLSYAVSKYLIHRFIFHMNPPKIRWLLTMLKRLHYDHHVSPNQLNLLFLPVWYSLPLIMIAGSAAFFITKDFSLMVAFVTGIMGYLLYYEWTHYIAHQPVQPITPWGRWMKRMHLWHHYKNENYWYGVTNPALDLLFCTYKNEKQVNRSSTARNLEQNDMK